MDPSARQSRLRTDHELLTALGTASTIFSFEATGDPSERYVLAFRGKGLARVPESPSDIGPVDLHQIELRMPYSYPMSPPDIRWVTPIWHPNVSFSGFINLGDIGITWSKELTLDVVVERLWDVARAAYINSDRATNFAAKSWFEKQNEFDLPLDRRPLRDRVAPIPTNVIRYERQAGEGVQLSPAGEREVVVIDENTPTPEMPKRRPYVPVSRRRARGDDDVLYIGPE
jgi:hypothetical protein